METLTIGGFPQLFRFHSPSWGSERVAVCKVGSSTTCSFGCRIATQMFPLRQRYAGRSGKISSYLIDSHCIVENNSRRFLFRLREAFNTSRGFPSLHRRFADGKQGPACRNESLRIHCNIKGRKFYLSSATGDDGSSAKSGDSTLETDDVPQTSTTSTTPTSSSSSEQVDWNKLIFNWTRDEPMWKVPWTGQTIFQVMVLWFAAFWVMGSWVLPIAAQIAGFSRHTLTFRGQALYSLLTDIAEGTVGIWILKRCLAQFYPLPEGWFPLKWQGKWVTEALWGCLLFPFVNKLSQLNLYLIPLPALTGSYVDQSMMTRDPVATLLYAIVISVCAPVWEEVIFRGFLLPSMTRYMPLWGAILVSAVAFAMAHFSVQRILPLTFLGLVMGFVFVRSKNLLACIVLHSLWNGFAFLELL